VSPVLDVAGETAQEVFVRVHLDREIVPAEARPERPALAEALTRTQDMRDRAMVVDVRDGHPAGDAPEVGDAQNDVAVVAVVAAIDVEVGGPGRLGHGALESAHEAIRSVDRQVVPTLRTHVPRV